MLNHSALPTCASARRVAWCALALAAALPAPAAGQGLPPFQTVNPVLTSRSGLRFEPLADLPAAWGVSLQLDYGSLIEFSERERANLLLDAEVMRGTLSLTRRLGERGFVRATAAVGGSYAGFLDGPINAYHDLLGFRDDTRSGRPDNVFEYEVEVPDGTRLSRDPGAFFLGDLVLAGGILHSPHWQTVASVTLPTHSGPEGYGVETVAASVATTGRTGPIGRLTVEGSAGVGFTPRTGALAEFQRTLFGLASAGARFRFWGRQSAYANLIYHSPGYAGTTLPGTDGSDLVLDMGFLFLTGNGTEILAGLAEDLYPLGPAVDVVFRMGVRW